MPSQARQQFDNNKADVGRLIEIHTGLSGDTRGRKYDVDVLNRAAMIFVLACWESYVEDLVVEASDFVLAKAVNANVVPSPVRVRASRALRDDKDERRVWDLADQGWKDTLRRHRDTMLGSFHSPRTENVVELFRCVLDLRDLSASWHWRKMSPTNAATRLDELVGVRGNIAHRLKHQYAVWKKGVALALNHIERLVEATDVTVAEHVKTIVGSSPW